MSIKWKVPLLTAIILVLNLFMLYELSQYVFSPKITEKLNNMKESLNIAAQQTANEVRESGDIESIKSVLENRAIEGYYKIVLKRLSDGKSDVFDYSKYGNMLEATAHFINYGEYYQISISKGMENTMIAKIEVVQQILILESAVVLFTFCILTIFIYDRSVKPLNRLNTLIQSYNKTDNNKKKKLNDEIAEIENSFKNLTENLENEKTLQNRIIASISHDIKTPLTSVLGYSERLLNKNITEDKKRLYLETIYKQAQNIDNILEQFDDFIINQEDTGYEFKEYDLKYISDLLKEEYSEYLKDRNIGFEVFDFSQGCKLKLDINRMRRVFANIISNSINHSKTEELKIKVEIYQDSICFYDNGKGVDIEIQDKIFQPFFTSNYSRKISGLGLSICQNIMEKHKGTIMAENTDGGFLVKLNFTA